MRTTYAHSGFACSVPFFPSDLRTRDYRTFTYKLWIHFLYSFPPLSPPFFGRPSCSRILFCSWFAVDPEWTTHPTNALNCGSRGPAYDDDDTAVFLICVRFVYNMLITARLSVSTRTPRYTRTLLFVITIYKVKKKKLPASRTDDVW